MRILALTNLYPNPYQPNRATFNRHPLRLLAEQHSVRVIAPVLWTDERNARRAGAARLPGNRQMIFDDLTVDHPRYWYTPKALRSCYGHFFLWSVRSVFRKVVEEFQPDIVFTPWVYPDGWAAVRLARRFGLPVVLKIHGSDVRLVDDFRGRDRGTVEALNRAHGVVAVSQDLATRAIQLGADPGRVTVITNGVDRAKFSPGDRCAAQTKLGLCPGVRHLLFVGNLVAVKGLDVLLTALAQLPAEIAPWELHIIGEGNLRGPLVEQAAASGLANQVRFHGGRPHAELPDWFRAADLFVLPSRSEGTPNVLLEAAACGTPFVATNVGGIPAIAHLGASRLVPPTDPVQLATAIAGALVAPPPKPVEGPRDSHETAADLAEFLIKTLDRSRSRHIPQVAGPSPVQ